MRLGYYLVLGLGLTGAINQGQKVRELCSGFVSPELEKILRIQNEMNFQAGLTKISYNKVIDKVFNVYNPIFKAKGWTFKVERLWSDNTVNAQAEDQGDIKVVRLFGGLARLAEISEDGFALVFCHETGHHLGENPLYPGSTLADEGQSDYFGVLKCFKKVFETDDNIKLMSQAEIPAEIQKQCTNFYPKSPEDIALCERSSLAGLNLGIILAGDPSQVSVENHDTSVVTETSHEHPEAQCRLDTYLYGSYCTTSHMVDFDANDENLGACYKEMPNFQGGERPLCWFKPKN